jgi:hypothetical protein
MKTMNVQYLKKIFSSEEFYAGYLEYLGKNHKIIAFRKFQQNLG